MIELDLLHVPFRQSRKNAYHLSNKVLCYKLCNNSAKEYEYLYNAMEITELYIFVAIGLATNKLSKHNG